MKTRKDKEKHSLLPFLLLAFTVMFAGRTADLAAQQIGFPSATEAGPNHSDGSIPASQSPQKKASATELVIPFGTILPVRLNSSLSSKSKPGEEISATIMQDVPLPGGTRIPRGSHVAGRVLEATGRSNSPATLSITFDKLVASHQTVSITTNLRAIAGFVAVRDAQTPPNGTGESDVYVWLTTVQIGGDVVYGEGGPVTKGDDASQVVGRAVPGGVLSRISAREGTGCRGPLSGNDSLQALWVFSSDACGAYGLAHLEISHAGRDTPVGQIVFRSEERDLRLGSGTGMLLRVN